MLRLFPALWVLLAVVGPISAQPAVKDVAVDTKYLRTLAETRSFQLGRPVRPLPTPDGKAVLFLRSEARSSKLSLFEFDVDSGKTRELISPADVLKGAEEKLSPEEKAARERMRVSVGGFTNFQLSDDGSLVLLSLSGKLFTFERGQRKVRELPAGKGFLLDPKFSPDGKMVSYVRAHDLYVLSLADGKELRVTFGGTELKPHATAEFVAQEEMARFTGYWWSPDSRHLAYQATDNTAVEIWRVADPMYPGALPVPFYYPRPGKNNAIVRLGVTSLVSEGKTIWLDWNRESYPYLASVRWPKNAPLCLTVQSRDQHEVAILQADPKTGKTATLLVEKSPTWVNLRQEVPRWLPSGDGFLWVSEKDDVPRLELRSANGRFRRVVVNASLGYQNLVSLDDQGEELIFNASVNPTQSQLYRFRLFRIVDEPEPITKEPGQYGAVYAKNHGLSIVTSRTMKSMPRSMVHRHGKLVGELPSVAEEPKRAPVVDLVEVKAKGKTFYAAVVFPHNYDERKKYPVIVDVYGGPHHLHVAATQTRWLLDQWYADQGFIVVALDGRGTPGRGATWERAIYQKFGSVPLDDQVAGLQALGAKFPMMDLKRVGIDGWSFGGYLSALAVMRRPDVFQAGVAGAPVCDWLDYDTHYTERYLGVPPAAGAAYREGSLLTYAGELKRPLMILHGTADDNVYFRHSLKIVDALFKAGKDFEMVPLSGLTHMVPDPLVMERLHGRIALFFQKRLGGLMD